MLRSLRTLAAGQSRTLSTLRVVESTHPSRSLALPLCFVSVRILGFDLSTSPDPWRPWIDRFAAEGYSSLVVDLDPELHAPKTSELFLAQLEQQLVKLLRDGAASPFPPLLFASSAASLVAETYVSSHPLSGLVLDRPLAATRAHSHLPSSFPTPLDEFDYEPLFPVAVLDAAPAGQTSPTRLLSLDDSDSDDDSLVRRIAATRDDHGWQQVMDWMDENGL